MLRFCVSLGCLSWDKIYVVCVLELECADSEQGPVHSHDIHFVGLVTGANCSRTALPGRDGDLAVVYNVYSSSFNNSFFLNCP
jgi:hypothetical protein